MNRWFRLAIFFCLLAAPFARPAEIPKFEAKPVKVVDRFETDTRRNYHTAGDVTWSTLKLTIPKDASLAFVKTIDAVFQCDFELWPKGIEDGKDCVTRLNFVLVNGYEFVVVVQRVNQGGRVLRQVIVVEADHQASEKEPKLDTLAQSQVFSLAGDVERWSLKYRNGIIDIRCNDMQVVKTCGQGFLSWCNAFVVTQLSGVVELTRFALDGVEAGYTPEQRAVFDQTMALRAEAEKALASGDIKLAIQIEEKRIPLMESAFGKDYAAIGLIHEWVAQIADNLKRPKDARDRFQKAADAFTKQIGADHPTTLRMRVWVGYETGLIGNIDEAESISRPAALEYFRIAGAKGAAGQQTFVLLWDVLEKKSLQLLKQGDYGAYQRYRQEIMQLCAAVHGPESTYMRKFSDDYDLATLIVQAASEAKPQIAAIVVDVARVNELFKNGEIDASRQLTLELIPRCRKFLGDEHPLTADTLISAAAGEGNAGNFGSSVKLLEEGVAIRRKISGENDVMLANALISLADAYSVLERYDEAAPQFEEARKILVARNLTGDVTYARLQLEYGRHLQRIGQFQQAIAPLQECIKIYTDAGRAADPDALKASERLANIYRAAGDTATAEKMLEFQKQQLQSRQGNLSQSQVDVMMQEAIHLSIRGRYDESIAKYREIIPIVMKLYGRRSRAYQVAVEGLLESYALKGDQEQVGRIFGELLEFARLRRESLFEDYTPFQQFAQSASDRTMLNQLMALAASGYITDEVAYQHLLQIKGAVTAYQRRAQLAASNPELRELLGQRQRIGSQLAAMLVRPMSSDDAKRISELVSQRDKLDAEMSRRSAAYRAVADVATVDRIRSLLTEGTAVIDYVEFERSPTWLEGLFSSSPRPQIAVFVVTKQGGVRRFDLGPAVTIERKFLQWADASVKEIRNLGDDFDPRLEQETDRAGSELRKMIWDPFQDFVKDADTIVISPDGLLVQCPFAALPVADNKSYLVEQKAIAFVTAVNLLPDLLRLPATSTPAKALFVGDVDYESADGSATAEKARDAGEPDDILYFEHLDNGKQAIAALRALYEKQFAGRPRLALTGRDASEANLRKSLGGTTFVHMHTHGFAEHLSTLQGLAKEDVPADQWEFDPLIAGVALAGANHASRHNGASDGILWASEIAMLDLRDAELVTLSACETALGGIFPGEGMQGCQRALTIAGVHSTLTSIWSVADMPTRVLMLKFYENLWVRHQSKAQSCQAAMRYMLREYDWSPSRVAEKNKTHRCPPIVWSSWVLYGDWR